MNQTSIFRRYKLDHLLGWLLLFGAWHFFRYQDYPRNVSWLISALKVVDLAIMVYITNYLLIPQLLYKRKYVLFAIVYLVMITGFSWLKMYVQGQLINRPSLFNVLDKGRFYDNVIPHILLVSTGAAIKLLIDHARSQRRLGELSKEKAEAELNFLKSQINPHFLFNSLNAIYFLIDKQNTTARQTLLQFSDLLRYQLYDCNAPVIEIEKEVAYLQDYIRLQQLRKDHHYDVNVAVDAGVRGFSITPLLLIPFVENAFKHVSHHPDQPNFVHVSMGRENGSFLFQVENSKETHQRTTEPPGGIGLNNVKRRLELLYPGKYELQIDNNDTTFKVALNLHLS
ncbi:histidine kinase [Paraflavitalea sp. CAU 1676]|uniref:sensor histidine kinase n=1 Tax=Paraflavitalea sp. CAU 1676 TaxID=3032598 RepID=UPI0023DBC29D|nr:histidine kinase [Paraflavitalea sp. CAU 1676]MDF2188148.1 histidine kinase [Paraflavitalea sp. CAU 1676]